MEQRVRAFLSHCSCLLAPSAIPRVAHTGLDDADEGFTQLLKCLIHYLGHHKCRINCSLIHNTDNGHQCFHSSVTRSSSHPRVEAWRSQPSDYGGPNCHSLVFTPHAIWDQLLIIRFLSFSKCKMDILFKNVFILHMTIFVNGMSAPWAL